ncbi:hypothetical protein [Listeria seeligeri]|uniref:hypothetical protein n=1 Tax=Listeria seeligeri TaxID=1640 RepID=UPI001E605C4F|nr:hypothetical protein [Listeria seeligeri]
MKDGKVDAEATNAYNETILNGTLPKETNAATQEAELLKGILASLKNKKDPITGADISSVQVLSILSGLAFSYRAGRYRGKKLRIPNPDKRKKKKKKETSGANELLDKKLLDELAASGVKYNPEDVVMITKAPDGKLLWLEKGNDKVGLKHIVNGHAADFEAKGIKDIPSFLNEVLKAKPIKTGVGKNGPFADYLVDGVKYRVAYGTNGFIVSFYPID